jgi:hypothetical protein
MLRKASIQWGNAPVQHLSQEPRCACRCSDVDLRAGFTVSVGAFAILKKGLLTRVRTDYLVAHLCRSLISQRDRAGTDNLIVAKRFAEPGKRCCFSAGEAKASVALCVGTIRSIGWTGVHQCYRTRDYGVNFRTYP